jgi:hypothetical protein
MFTTRELLRILLLISPILLIQVGMAVYSFVDLSHRQKVRGPRWAWVLGIVLSMLSVPSGVIVAGLYLAWGRHPKEENDPR